MKEKTEQKEKKTYTEEEVMQMAQEYNKTIVALKEAIVRLSLKQ